MSTAAETPRDLVLSRVIPISRQAAFRAWTEPELLKQWFSPRPWTTPDSQINARPGGTSRTVMRSPEGEDHTYSGVFLKVVPDRKLVITDAYTSAWEPSEKPFFTLVLTLEDEEGGGTLYTACARHWTLEDRDNHERMGFHQGWGQCLDQLIDLMQRQTVHG